MEAGQRELTDHQASSVCVLEAEIHGRATRKDPQGDQLAREYVGISLAIAALDADKQKHALVDAPHDLGADPDFSARDSLDDGIMMVVTRPA